ncbi:HAD family hydrolase [Gleimia hominis]|uniref:HAD family hydrolase n=1 Tax=Gleimia hominis TaxID=595468 RepID=A0ABU3I9Y3_9ACTO|nr:HAD family hydrolase [Gleimia hominis]MDT3767189.1 HAD family hydrolase [Gleimia hominis]
MKLVCIDVDGTIIDHNQRVPASAAKAIKQAVANGHTLVMCTGRSHPEIYPKLWDLGFRGLIGANGAFVEYENEVVDTHLIPHPEIQRITKILEAAKAHWVWQSHDQIVPSRSYYEAFQAATQEGQQTEGLSGDWSEYVQQIEPYVTWDLPKDSSKCTFTIPTDSPLTFEQVASQIGGDYLLIPGSVSVGGITTELTAQHVTKGKGLRKLAQHLGINMADTIGIGDSANDIPMLETSGLGIAMGNGIDEVKKVANWVAPPLDDNGLAAALNHAGLTA